MTPYYQDSHTTQYCGHVLEVLPQLPAGFVQCVVTSPPYWGLRKYEGEQEFVWGTNGHCDHEWLAETVSQELRRGLGIAALGEKYHGGGHKVGQVGRIKAQRSTCGLCGAWRGAYGLEPTPEMYVEHTIEILREIRRVLKNDGVVWWNIADSYATAAGQGFIPGGGGQGQRWSRRFGDTWQPNHARLPGLKRGDLCQIPQRVALAAQADGWWVRSWVIWSKPNPMPESVSGWRWERHRVKVGNNGRGSETFRSEAIPGPQQDHDGRDFRPDAQWQDCPGCPKCAPHDGYVLRKGSWRPADSHEYILMLAKSADYYADGEAVREAQTGNAHSRGTEANSESYHEARGSFYGFRSVANLPNGRNLRTVWEFPTQPYPEAHFAVFPEELPERCILSSTSERGNCSKCGAPWVRVVERKHYGRWDHCEGNNNDQTKVNRQRSDTMGDAFYQNYAGGRTIDWWPSCSCGAASEPAVVLDTFSGSGTTLWKAKALGRRAIGVDVSSEYCDLGIKRNEQQALAI